MGSIQIVLYDIDEQSSMWCIKYKVLLEGKQKATMGYFDIDIFIHILRHYFNTF